MKTETRRGNMIFLVLIIATALGAVVFSTLDLVRHESRLNKRANLYHEARLASESLLQSSFADLQRRFDQNVAFPKNELAPDRNPLEVPSEFMTRYIGDISDPETNLVQPTKTKYTDFADFQTEPTEVIGGPVPPGSWRFIERDVPGDDNDPLEGSMAFVRHVEILAKATVSKTGTAENITAYSRQLLEVRDAPLFAHAIFYNVPMEIAPGPLMDVFGNVHSNGDMYIQGGSGLNFRAKVTSAGEIYHGRRDETGMGTSQGPVNFVNEDGDLISMQEDNTWDQAMRDLHTGDGWLESDHDEWATIAKNLYDGNVLNAAHNVDTQNPVGVMDYVEDDDPSTDAKEAHNHAYQLIQPVLAKSELAIPDPDTVSSEVYERALDKAEIELQKFAYKAGLTVSVSGSGNVSMHTFQRDGSGNIVYDGSGNPQKMPISPKGSAEFIRVEQFASLSENGSETITSGLHDKREGRDMNIVEVDVGKLKDVIHNNDANDFVAGGAPSDWWNGVVYVEFPQQQPTSTRVDNVNPAIEGWGVKLTNAQTIRSPSFAQSKGIYGSSFATNSPVYIDGHYNADGDDDTGSPTEPDADTNYAGEGNEAPSAIAADAVNFLSTAWDDVNSNKSKNSYRVASDFTEVSAAILAGNVPSGKTGTNSYSGGVENFPRFLEKWSGKELRIRGSIVALYESEVATERWGKGDVYNPPQRKWGFHEKLGEGFYPPGTPSTRTYRGRDYRDLNAEQYDEAVENIKSSLASL